jgi:hypothetical protein
MDAIGHSRRSIMRTMALTREKKYRAIEVDDPV